MTEDANKRFADLEARVSALENLMSKPSKVKPHREKESKGPKNAIRKAIQEGCFDTPKASKEVEKELNRQGCFYSLQSIDHSLRSLNGIELTRIKAEGIWKYVVRK